MRPREGDLLVLCTDGVFDNLFIDEMTTIVKQYASNSLRNKQSARLLAQQIVKKAHSKANQENSRTPYGLKKQNYMKKGEVALKGDICVKDEGFDDCAANGGKNDDTTAVCIWISQKCP